MRLHEADPSNAWVEGGGEDVGDETRADVSRGESQESVTRREIELCRREKELAERELALARREIAMLREQRRRDSVGGDEEAAAYVEGRMTPRVQPKMNLSTIGDLLSDFDGVSGDFDTWEKQVRSLKQAYQLDDDYAKILIGMKLKRKAFEFFHSRPEYVSMPFELILEKLKAMFQRRESRVMMRKKFESRIWKREETFHEYLHEKIIMGNRVPVDENELIEHVIDGIPDVALRDQERIQGFTTMDSLLRAFEKVTLRDRGISGSQIGRTGEAMERRGVSGASGPTGPRDRGR